MAGVGGGDNNGSRVIVHSKLTAVSSKPVGPGKTCQLSSLDHAMGLHSLHMIFYYKKKPFGSFDLDPLRVSLSKVLSLYPAVTGRLARDETGNWVVKCNDAGVRVVRANVGVTLDEWLISGHGLEEKDLTVWGEVPDDPSTWSPFQIQINEFEGDGVALGLSCTHMLADATSLVLLFRSWIDTFHQESIKHSPLFRLPAVHSREVQNTHGKSSYYATKANAQAPLVKMDTATFKFSSSSIKECLTLVHDQCPEATPFELLAALFWTRITRLKAPKHDHGSSLTICLDFRGLLQPPLPLGFFGNALHFSHLSVEDMDGNELGQIVELLHRHVSGMNHEDVWSDVEWLESQKEEGGKFAPAFKMYGPELTCVGMEHMFVGNESLMYSAMFENDEKPVHVTCHVGNVEGEGLIMVLPSPEEGLARTVMVTLPEEELTSLRQDQAILQLKPTMLLNGSQ